MKLFQLLTDIFFIPHFLIYKFSPSKALIHDDLCANGVRRHSTIFKKFGPDAYFFVLIRDEYYRKVFYHRTGKISELVSWYSPGCKYFSVGGQLGGGIYCIHSYSTILHAKSIGKNFACRQCTTLGLKNDIQGDTLPVIGDNVTLGANVVIIGSVTVGDNVTIGAGSVVVKDIPSNCIACGNPAKVIRTIETIDDKE